MASTNLSATSSHLRDLLSRLDVDGAAPRTRRDGGVIQMGGKTVIPVLVRHENLLF